MFIKDTGLVININIYRNTSQLVKLFLQNNGYILGYAKGIYKINKLDFDGPFNTFCKYEIEMHGNITHNDIVLITSSKHIRNIEYKNIEKMKFIMSIQKFIEEFFIFGYKDRQIYKYLDEFIQFIDCTDNLKFIHYACFVANILKLMGLLNNTSIDKLNMSKRMQSFIKFLLATNLPKEINIDVNDSLQREFLFSIKNNFYHYYNTHPDVRQKP